MKNRVNFKNVRIDWKKIFSKKAISIGGIVVFIGIIAFASYGLLRKQQQKNAPSPTPTPTVTATEEITPTATKPPKADTEIYYGTYKGKKGILLLSDSTRYYTSKGKSVYDKNVGYFIGTNSDTQTEVKKSSISQPLLVTKTKNNVQTLFYSPASDKDSIFYVTYSTGSDKESVPIFKSSKVTIQNDKKLAVTDIWNGENLSTKYKDAKDVWSVPNATEEYLSINLGTCNSCDGTKSAGNVVINTVSLNEKFVELAANIKLQLSGKVFTYQKVAQITLDCNNTENPYCVNGKLTYWGPTGGTYTDNLPK